MALFEAIVNDFKGDFSLILFVTHTESALDVLCRSKPPCLLSLGPSTRGHPANSVETAPRTELAPLKILQLSLPRACQPNFNELETIRRQCDLKRTCSPDPRILKPRMRTVNTEGSDRLAHTLLVNCGCALAKAVDEQDLLQSVCNTLVNNCGFRLTWFGLTEPGTSNSIRLVAQAGDQDGF